MVENQVGEGDGGGLPAGQGHGQELEVTWHFDNFDDSSKKIILRWRSRGEVEKSQRREEAAVKTVRASKQVTHLTSLNVIRMKFQKIFKAGRGICLSKIYITNFPFYWVYVNVDISPKIRNILSKRRRGRRRAGWVVGDSGPLKTFWTINLFLKV